MEVKLKTIEELRERCGGNVLSLGTNYRAPKYLLDLCNVYAEKVLNVPPKYLPAAAYDEERMGNELVLLCSTTQESEIGDVSQQAQRLSEQHPEETIAILVLNNNDADVISERMEAMGVQHFKISGSDLFSSPEVKLLIAHLSVFVSEYSSIAWTHIFKGFRVYEQESSARHFIRELSLRGLSPLDLLLYPQSSYIQAFAEAYEEQEIVVFDTETTGLDVYQDDIIQIAAVKLRRGTIVEGSALSLYIQTDKTIPPLLGDIVNPILAEREHHTLLSHEEALSLFLDYIGSDVLLAHNADYDYTILDNNLRRFLPSRSLSAQAPIYYDSLRIVRLLFPSLQSYKLKELLQHFNLEGANSHLADDDVDATCHLVRHCYECCQERIPEQRTFLSIRSVQQRANLLRASYLPAYRATRSRLKKRQEADGPSLLADELRRLYNYLVAQQFITPIRSIEYIYRYITSEFHAPTDYDLLSQLRNHLIDLSTLKESDLCSSGNIEENIIISTIFKGKGLEFDNIIIYDVNDDRYPARRFIPNEELDKEDARKLYVALTRARKRLMVTLSTERKTFKGGVVKRRPSPFLYPLLPFFSLRDAEGKEISSAYIL